MTPQTTEKTFLVSGMDCASCAQKIATGVNRLDGVQSCSLNYTTGKLHVAGDIPREEVIRRVNDLGYDVIEPGTERILGVGIVGVGAGDMIAEGTLAIEMAANAKDLSLTIHPHPTLSETMMGAAEVFFGQATDMYRPKRK